MRDVVADGRVVAANSPTLYAIAAGTVDFHVRAGDKVTRGQSLATIASPELQSRLTPGAGDARRASRRASAAPGSTSSTARRTRRSSSRRPRSIARPPRARSRSTSRCSTSGVIPELELRRSRGRAQEGRDRGRATRTSRPGSQGKELVFDLGTKQAERSIASARSSRELERQVAALEITSPVDGQVGQLLVAQRATVAANAPIVTRRRPRRVRARDPGARQLRARPRARHDRRDPRRRDDVPRPRALGVARGRRRQRRDPARVRRPAARRAAPEPAADRAHPDRGARRRARRSSAARSSRPAAATSRTSSRTASPSGAPIRTGAISLDAVEILSGAKVGDQIVVAGADAFGDAQRVRIAELGAPHAEDEGRLEGVPDRDGRDPRAARPRPRGPRGRVRRGHRAVGLGQDDVPQHRRPARGADRRRATCSTASTSSSSTIARARSCATRRSASCSRAST